MIVGVIVVQLVRGKEIELLWTETLMIALAHYFASRRFIRLPPEVIKQLVDEGHIELEARPLYLPSYSIRVILLLAFVAVGIYLYLRGGLWKPQPLSILGVVFAYLSGIIVRVRSVRGWEDTKAAVVLVVMAVASVVYLCDLGGSILQPLRNMTLGLVLFYFGSR
jgi:hypothetical protein